eukprot:scaffold199278_cov33-Tisochrysis_lutea.AAC.2
MRCCGVSAVGLDDADAVALEQQNGEIKRHLDESEDVDKGVMKLLLLGAGESGKSTLFKQMKVINKDGYSEDERRAFQGIIWSNTIGSMKNLLDGFEKLQIEMPGDVVEAQATLLAETNSKEILTPELGKLIHTLWRHDAVQAVFDRRNEFQLNDSADYYFEAVQRIANPRYLPTTDDVLHSRVRTTGIVQSDFRIHSTTFTMFDVGGQRNERRKWIHCFDHVNAVCFVAAISEFDQVLYEDPTQNRLDESLELFKQVSNSKWFRDTSIILFLNKKDLFEKKLAAGKRLSDYRKDYNGANTPEECTEYLKQLFLKQIKPGGMPCYTHVTTATDTNNVKFVFNAIVNIVLEDNIRSSGLS